MIAKTLHLFLFIFLGFKLSAGCDGPHLSINGVIRHEGDTKPDFYTFKSSDSIMLRGETHGCGSRITKIYFDDSLIYTPQKSSFKIRAASGNYKIYVFSDMGMYRTNIFSFSIIDPLAVGLEERQKSEQFLTIGPNPAKELISINSNSEIIKTIEIFNSVSQMLDSISPNASTLSMPLGNYPPGIYFIKVATLNGRTTMRKFIIQ